jgi:hypothetical protein
MTNQTKTQSEARANYVKLVRAVGAGFHPDTMGSDYASVPDVVGDADGVDIIVDAAFEDFSIDDPYALAIRALEDGADPLPHGDGDYQCSACREPWCVGECVY